MRTRITKPEQSGRSTQVFCCGEPVFTVDPGIELITGTVAMSRLDVDRKTIQCARCDQTIVLCLAVEVY